MNNIDYRLAPEWGKHEATWLVWPQNSKDWPGKFSAIKWIYIEIVKYLSESEIVRIIVNSKKIEERVRKDLNRSKVNTKKVQFVIAKTDRSWIRDSGPFFVFDEAQKVKIIDFGFNSWAKYSDWQHDNKVPKKISEYLRLPIENKQEVVLEGGSLDVNGTGALITTEQCLLSENKQVRNEGLKKKDYEELFRECFGVTNVLWLGEGIAGDDTNGHVDDLCRFVSSSTVVVCEEKNENDENFYPIKENKERLQSMRLEDGSKLEVVALPMPEARYFEGFRLPASYTNFYIANNVVLVPTFNDPNDYKTIGVLSEFFPERKVVGINCSDLIWGFGAIHCLTKEQPYEKEI